MLSNDKNKVTTQAARTSRPSIRMNVDEWEKKNDPVGYWSRKWLKKVWESKEFWPAYEWIKDADAEEFLMALKEWEVRGAYTYKWHPVDLMRWDNNFWLKKLMNRHKYMLWKIQHYLDTLPQMNQITV